MAQIFITGSADGLGLMAAKLLIEQGHEVTLHARNQRRADDAARAAKGSKGVIIGDLSSIAEMKSVAEQANAVGPFDAVIHNAAVGYQESRRQETVDGLSHVFAINSLAPYVLTALMEKPKRLIYLSSGLHRSGDSDLNDIDWRARRWSGITAYSESKFHDALLAFAVARLCPDVLSNALEPGWVATKMGGPGATDDLDKGHRTQVWLATSNESAAKVSGQYFFHQKMLEPHPSTKDIDKQNKFLALCQEFSGVEL